MSLKQITDLNYRGWSYETAFSMMLNEAYENGVLSNNTRFLDYISKREDIESELVMNYSIIAETLFDEDTGAIQLLKDTYEARNINTASGDDLDVIGEYFGLYRIGATYSVAEINISIDEVLDSELEIPIGTKIQTRNDTNKIIYQIQNTVTIPAGQNSCVANAVSMTPSYDGRIAAGELGVLVDNLSNDVNVTIYNPMASVGGLPEETDSEFRERIKTWSNSVPRTTYAAYQNFMRSIDGLKGYKLIPRWNGNGTLKIVVAPSNEVTIQRIQELIDDHIKGIDDDITVIAANEVPVDINVTINTDIDQTILLTEQEKNNIKLNVENYLKIFINGGDLKNGNIYEGLLIGEDFIPSKCISFLRDNIDGLQNITFIEPASTYLTDVNGNYVTNNKGKYYALLDSEVVTVEADEIATVGNINVEVE